MKLMRAGKRWALLVLLAVACAAAVSAQAGTNIVSSTADTGPDAPLPGTLRAALASAADGDTIDATGITGTITLMRGMINFAPQIMVDKSVTILGPGPTNLTVDANHLGRVFFVTPGHTVTIEGLSIVNGEVSGSFPADAGGGIYNRRSALTVNNCTISGNSAEFGGGIYNDGVAGSATLTVVNSTLNGNSGVLGYGGGIYNNGGDGGSATLTVANSTVNANTGVGGGGGIFNDTGYAVHGARFGNATLTVSNCTVSGNSAHFGSGGGIVNVGEQGGNATVTVDHTILSDNSADLGGGIASFAEDSGNATLTVDHSTLSGNTGTHGAGGIYSESSSSGKATLAVDHSTLSANSTDSLGGGIYNVGSATNENATATIANSTLSGNSAGDDGGAIYNFATKRGHATMALGNCTLSGNLAQVGGAIVNDVTLNEGDADVKVLACTLSGNSASDAVGGIASLGTAEVGNTILKDGHGGNLLGNVVSFGFNLSSDNGGGYLTGTGDQIGRDPLLGPLADNGGSTLTHLPKPGSPAIDQGSSDILAAFGFTDQRGLPRTFDDPGTPNAAFGDGTDIGAVEIQEPTALNLVWTNLAGGDWNVASNWRPNFVPGTNDNAIVSVSATVTVSSPAVCFGLTLGSLSSSPTLTGSGTLTLYGPSAWVNGTMSGSGRTIISPGATLNVASPNGVSLTTRTLENGGTVLWTGTGSIGMTVGAVVTNRAGALFRNENATAVSLGGGGAGGRFDNAGAFRKSVGTATTSVAGGVSFNNSGTVDIQTGTLDLGGSGTHSGSFAVPAGAALTLSGGTQTADGSSSVTGAGQLTVSGGTITLAGLVNASGGNVFSGGTANLTGNYICTNNTLTISGGTANFNGTGAVMPTVISLSNGALGGSNVVTLASQMDWTGGTMSGSGRTIISPGATLNVASPNGVSLTGRTLENGGTVLWTGTGLIGVTGGAVVTNRAGALFRNENMTAASLGGGGAGGRFDNAGAFRKSVGTATTSVAGGLSFNNSGTVDIQTGTLDLGGSGTYSGSFAVQAGAALTLSGGTQTADGSSSVTGAGQLTVSGGAITLAGLVNASGGNVFSGGTANLTGNYICTNNTITISGSTANCSGTGLVSPAVLNLSNGTLDGTSTVTVNTSMNWTGGTMSGSGRTIISPGATLNVASPNGVSLTSRTLENGGTVLWTGTGSIGVTGGAVVTNRPGALFRNENGTAVSLGGGGAGGRFDNAGTFRKSVGTATTTVAVGVSFNNSGTVDIRSGILAANGAYTSASTALLNCALGGTTAGTTYGQLQVVGTVTLNGALSVDLINGFAPAVNDSFTVLTAGARTSTFGNFYFPSNQVTMLVSNSAVAVIVRVAGFLAPPLVLFPPALAGSNVLLTWTARSNATYRLEFNPDLKASNWGAVPGDVISLGSLASKLDPLTSSNRVYRVHLLP